MPLLSLRDISKRFGSTRAVIGVSLAVEAGEFFGLLGPSGCGKTTTLRIIAGLEAPETGTVECDGHNITDVASEHRGFGVVFQNYALFPHLNVFENVAFGLRARRLPRHEVSERVSRALELVQLPRFDERAVDELSGGQQQRVAIARAIVIEPSLLLFDEPLSNLDVALREETRRELRALVKRLGLTAIYVTHDQEEAFALCDRIAVMFEGRILQTGTPRNLYDAPATAKVAQLLGRNNLIRAMRLSSSSDAVTRFKTIQGDHTLMVKATREQLVSLPLNKPCLLAIRPEALSVSKPIESGDPSSADANNRLRACVQQIEFAGVTTMLKLNANGLTLEALVLRDCDLAAGEECAVFLPPDQIKLFPLDSFHSS